MNRKVVGYVLCLLLSACHARRVDEASDAVPQAHLASPSVPRDGDDSTLPAARDELEPGSVRAFGLVMPLGSAEQFGNASTRMYYVPATLPRVMRYLERRLDIPNAEIHPLGAMLRGAHVRTTQDGENLFVDVGLREESDRTLVTIWNRTAAPVTPRTPEEGMRAAGFDPSGRPLPVNNR